MRRSDWVKGITGAIILSILTSHVFAKEVLVYKNTIFYDDMLYTEDDLNENIRQCKEEGNSEEQALYEELKRMLEDAEED